MILRENAHDRLGGLNVGLGIDAKAAVEDERDDALTQNDGFLGVELDSANSSAAAASNMEVRKWNFVSADSGDRIKSKAKSPKVMDKIAEKVLRSIGSHNRRVRFRAGSGVSDADKPVDLTWIVVIAFFICSFSLLFDEFLFGANTYSSSSDIPRSLGFLEEENHPENIAVLHALSVKLNFHGQSFVRAIAVLACLMSLFVWTLSLYIKLAFVSRKDCY